MEGFLPIVLAIAYAAFSLFSKVKEYREENQRKTKASSHQNPVKSIPLEERSDTIDSEHDKGRINPNPPLYNIKVNERNHITPSNGSSFHQIERLEVQKNVRTNQVKSSSIPFQKLSQKKLIQGIIMSEVLGPPRSLKSHYSSQRQKLPK